jgi:polyferredoxin
MYWAQRFALLNRCKRPTPGNNTVNTTMYQLIFAGPLLYSLGSFCWSNFMGDLPSGKIPNIAALVTSIFILVMPFQEISKQFVNHHQQP